MMRANLLLSVAALLGLPQGAMTLARVDATPGVADDWVVPPVVMSGAPLPMPIGRSVTWTVDGKPLPGGVLVNTGLTPVTVRLTGVSDRTRKTFTIRVLGRDARILIGYARTPTDSHDANQPVIARSLHLAMGRTVAEAVPLNGNYGVLFASGVYTGTDRVTLRGLADPALFYFADGTLGVIATRVAMSGTPDAAVDALVFKADPKRPTEWSELGSLDLRAPDGVVRPTAIWDSAARHYVVAWHNRGGLRRWAVVRDLGRTELVTAPFVPTDRGRRSQIATMHNVGPVRDGPVAAIDTVEPPNSVGRWTGGESATRLPVDAPLATALENRFGRLRNVGASVARQVVTPGHIGRLLATRARLTYSDGSTATRAVDWRAEDIARVARARSGRFTVRGTVRQPAYPAILAYNRADPAIYRYRHGGRVRYLFVATDDTGNDNVGSVHLPIRVADSIAALADDQGGRAREVDLLNRRTRRDRTVEGRVIAGCYWAPEIHEIGGRLSILFAPCFHPIDDQSSEGGQWSTVEAHIMQLRDGGDPADPNDWSKPAAVRKSDGTRLGRPDFPANISLDMSYFVSRGQAYYIWSQRYLTGTGPLGDPLTWIAKVDPAAPTRLTSAPRPVIAPSLSFEENLAEGGFAISHDGHITLVYSGSGVSPTYLVGGVRAREGDDLTDIDVWRKWSAPLQKSVAMPSGRIDYRTFEQGPGHGAFMTDEDGNPLYVYHSWGDGVGGDGRDARVRRMHWAADGRPVLDMTRDEEVAPKNRTVTVQVEVRGPAPKR